MKSTKEISERIAIHFNTEEELEALFEVFSDKRGTLTASHLMNYDDHPSDCINIERSMIGHCYRKWYEDEGYTIIEASDFLKDYKTITYEIY